MKFHKGQQFLDSIHTYSVLFSGNGFIAYINKNEIENAFSGNSKYRDFDFDYLFDLARQLVAELNENSNKHSFEEIEGYYNNKLKLFYNDLDDVFGKKIEIEQYFNEGTGLFGNDHNNKLHTIALGLLNVYKIIFDGLKQYFDIPISKEIYTEFYPFEIQTLPPQQNEKPKPELNKLSSIITHEKSTDIIKCIKVQYKNIKGKRLKLLLLALQELDLLPKEGIASKFHRLCKIEFDWEIASYNAMNGYNYNKNTDVEDFEAMVSFLKELINNK